MLTHRIVAYLVSLAVGYWVLTLADKQNGFTKQLGRVVGWIILVVSLLGPLCLAGKAVFCRLEPGSCRYSADCPWNGGGEMGMGHCWTREEGQNGDGGMMSGHCPMDGKGMMGGMKEKERTEGKAAADPKERSK